MTKKFNIYKNFFLGFGVSSMNAGEDDFILFPVPIIGYAKINKSKAIAIGIRFGFWVLFVSVYRIKVEL